MLQVSHATNLMKFQYNTSISDTINPFRTKLSVCPVCNVSVLYPND